MTDITLCMGYDCKRKEKCHRFTCQNRNPLYQSYFQPDPEDCSYFINNEEKEDDSKNNRGNKNL